jgi:hypothetical protein
MANSNPNSLTARLGKKKKSKPGNLKDVLGIVWEALETARELLGDSDPVMQLKAVHGVTQAAMGYAKLYEVGELENRLAALENNPVLTDRKEVQNGAFN